MRGNRACGSPVPKAYLTRGGNWDIPPPHPQLYFPSDDVGRVREEELGKGPGGQQSAVRGREVPRGAEEDCLPSTRPPGRRWTTCSGSCLCSWGFLLWGLTSTAGYLRKSGREGNSSASVWSLPCTTSMSTNPMRMRTNCCGSGGVCTR